MTIIPDLPVFSIGFWRGLYHTPAMVQQMVDNFNRFRYRPHGSINHDDELATGKVTKLRFDGATLFADVANLPLPVAELWNSGQLHAPSIEYWDTKNDQQAALTCGFRLPDGKVPGLVLKAVTLCGNMPPAVKNLGPMPKARYQTEAVTFADSINYSAIPASRRFSSEDFMDKATMIASLKAADPALSDETLNMLSDQQLMSLLNDKQGAAAGATVDTATPAAGAGAGAAAGAGAPVQMGDATDMAGMNEAAQKKFSEMSAAVADILRTGEQVKGLKKMLESESSKLVTDKVTTFVNSADFQTRVPPYQRKDVEAALRKCDPLAVRKFSDSATMGSELDEMIASIRKYPQVAKFTREFNDGTAPAASGNDRVANAIRVLESRPESRYLAKSMRERHGIPADAAV